MSANASGCFMECCRYFEAISTERKKIRVDENTLKQSILDKHREYLALRELAKAEPTADDRSDDKASKMQNYVAACLVTCGDNEAKKVEMQRACDEVIALHSNNGADPLALLNHDWLNEPIPKVVVPTAAARGIALGNIETYDINGNSQITESFGFDSKYLSTQRRRTTKKGQDVEKGRHFEEPYVAHYRSLTGFNRIRGASQAELNVHYDSSELDDIRRMMLLVLEKAPAKLQHLPSFLQQFQGQEEGLYKLLANRYGIGRPQHRDMSYEARLQTFLAEKAPERLGEVETLIANHQGTEIDLFVTLLAKYGPLWKERLVEYYEVKGPEYLEYVDSTLAEHKGQELELFKHLLEQYGPIDKYPLEEAVDGSKLDVDDVSKSFFEDEFGERPQSEEEAWKMTHHSEGGSSDDWNAYVDDWGATYWHNHITGETMWETPEVATGAEGGEVSALHQRQWEEAYTDDGTRYYHNVYTNESSWELPAAAAAAELPHVDATASGLPENWEEKHAFSGSLSYVNTVTGEERDTPPTATMSASYGQEQHAPLADASGAPYDHRHHAALPANWVAAYTEDGTVYYHNTATGESSWVWPSSGVF